MKKGGYIALIVVFLVLAISFAGISNAQVADSDRDGVPDAQDRCSNSQTTVVDQYGCTCAQKNCPSDNNPCADDCGPNNLGRAECGITIDNQNSCNGGYCLTGICVPGDKPLTGCQNGGISVVSDISTLADGNPSVATWVHPAWTANIPGATWIWKEYLVSNPSQTTTVTFTRTFELPADAKNIKGTFVIAADDLFKCYFNSDSTPFTQVVPVAGRGYYQEENKLTMSVDDYLKPGTNLLKCEVTNIGGDASGIWQATAQNNPAGLLYRLDASYGCSATRCGDGKCEEGAVTDTLLQTQGSPDRTKTYSLNGKNYEITLVFVDAVKALFRINKEETPNLNVGGSYKISDGTVILLKDILSPHGGERSATFVLGSCPQDCITQISSRCGDGVANQLTEECDRNDLKGKTCQSFGYNSGTLSCTADCKFDSQCATTGSCTPSLISIASDVQTLADGNPSVAAWVHPAWTAKIPGATWIWKEYLVSNPSQETTVAFTREFNLPANAESIKGTFAVASDDYYTCYLNSGTFFASEKLSGNYREEDKDSYIIDAQLKPGTNVLKCDVTNNKGDVSGPWQATAQNNPAGLLYRLGASWDCGAAICGDGTLDTTTEQCDDGNQNNNDACTNQCKNAVCGDGIIRTISADYDLNNDGKVDMNDHNVLESVVFGSSCPQNKICDINGNGRVNVADLVAFINLLGTGEDCDGTNLNGQTCRTKGFESGTLKCYAPETANQCKFDYSGCAAKKYDYKVYLDSRIKPPNKDFKIYTKNPEGPITQKIFAFIYNSSQVKVKTVELFNDGKHGDLDAKDYYAANSFSIADEGEYSASLCVGNSEAACSEIIPSVFDDGKPSVFEIRKMSCEPLYTTNNDKTIDRINMVLIGAKYKDIEQFKTIAKKAISLEGVPTVKKDSTGTTVDWGLFSIEPFKSNKDKFNIWYLSDQVKGKVFDFNEFMHVKDFCNLDNIYTSFIVNEGFGDNFPNGASIGVFPSFGNQKNIDKTNLMFGISYNSFPTNERGDDTINGYWVFAHETGHSLFGLADEYDKSAAEPEYTYPNCAHDAQEAIDWWGDLKGKIDPFYYEYKKVSEANGLQAYPENGVMTQYFYGGCGIPHGKESVIKPTEFSIMSGYGPVFGSVNRRRAEQVLNLFMGTPTCTDTDGGNKPEARGTVTDKFGTNHLDYCYDENTINEFYCNGIESVESKYSCGEGKACRGGACVQKPSKINVLVDLSHEFTFRYDIFGAGAYLPSAEFQKTSSFASLTSENVNLKDYDVVVGNYLISNIDYTDSEIKLLEDFVKNGGGLLITGKGEADYKLNKLTKIFGIEFKKEHVALPFKLSNHEINNGVNNFVINTGSIGTIIDAEGNYSLLVSDSNNKMAGVVKNIGNGFVAVFGEDEFISNPYQAEVVNKEFVYNLMKWLGRNKKSGGSGVPGRILPERSLVLKDNALIEAKPTFDSEVVIYFSERVRDAQVINFIKQNLVRVNAEIEKITGIKNIHKMNFVILANGGGYSNGPEVGIGSGITGTDILFVLAHELTHPIDNPNPPPEMMHPIASLVADRVGLAFGGDYEAEAKKYMVEHHNNLKRIDPTATRLDVAKFNGAASFFGETGDVHDGRWAKMYWIIGSLERTYKFYTTGMYNFPNSSSKPESEFLKRYFKLKRESTDFVNTPEKIVELMSLAACKNLYQDFKNIGTSLGAMPAGLDEEIRERCPVENPIPDLSSFAYTTSENRFDMDGDGVYDSYFANFGQDSAQKTCTLNLYDIRTKARKWSATINDCSGASYSPLVHTKSFMGDSTRDFTLTINGEKTSENPHGYYLVAGDGSTGRIRNFRFNMGNAAAYAVTRVNGINVVDFKLSNYPGHALLVRSNGGNYDQRGHLLYFPSTNNDYIDLTNEPTLFNSRLYSVNYGSFDKSFPFPGADLPWAADTQDDYKRIYNSFNGNLNTCSPITELHWTENPCGVIDGNSIFQSGYNKGNGNFLGQLNVGDIDADGVDDALMTYLWRSVAYPGRPKGDVGFIGAPQYDNYYNPENDNTPCHSGRHYGLVALAQIDEDSYLETVNIGGLIAGSFLDPLQNVVRNVGVIDTAFDSAKSTYVRNLLWNKPMGTSIPGCAAKTLYDNSVHYPSDGMIKDSSGKTKYLQINRWTEVTPTESKCTAHADFPCYKEEMSTMTGYWSYELLDAKTGNVAKSTRNMYVWDVIPDSTGKIWILYSGNADSWNLGFNSLEDNAQPLYRNDLKIGLLDKSTLEISNAQRILPSKPFMKFDNWQNYGTLVSNNYYYHIFTVPVPGSSVSGFVVKTADGLVLYHLEGNEWKELARYDVNGNLKTIQEKCSDGTLYNQCSSTKPKYCSNGNLIDRASQCGCPAGLVVSGENCVPSPFKEQFKFDWTYREIFSPSDIPLPASLNGVTSATIKGVYSPSVVKLDQKYHMFFGVSISCTQDDFGLYRDSIAHALSDDGINWKFDKYVLEPDSRICKEPYQNWPNGIAYQVNDPKIELDTHNANQIVMYYANVLWKWPYQDRECNNVGIIIFDKNLNIINRNDKFLSAVDDKAKYCPCTIDPNNPKSNVCMPHGGFKGPDLQWTSQDSSKLWSDNYGKITSIPLVDLTSYGQNKVIDENLIGGDVNFPVLDYDSSLLLYGWGEKHPTITARSKNKTDGSWSEPWQFTKISGQGWDSWYQGSPDLYIDREKCAVKLYMSGAVKKTLSVWPYEYYESINIGVALPPPDKKFDFPICKIPPPCTLKSAVWEKTSATEGEDVKLIVEGENCNGKQVSFVVKEDDLVGDDDVVHEPVSVVFADNKATATWKAEWQDDGILGGDPEYYFIASTDNAQIKSTNELSVAKAVLCGNNHLDAREDCDGTNLNSQSCQKKGFDFGDLKCSSCKFDTNGCVTIPYGIPFKLFGGTLSSESYNGGNVYSSEVILENGKYRMWYGGQGQDGHDRIHYAESDNGFEWIKKGVVLDNGNSNHVNDPSIVKVNGIYYMYYTDAPATELDHINLATSNDGINWQKRGVVSDNSDSWDKYLGRPMVIYDNGIFKMWYDGRSNSVPGSEGRVGYATSSDGLSWTKYAGNPIFEDDAFEEGKPSLVGGVNVKKIGNRYYMVYSGKGGTKAATSDDGIHWVKNGLFIKLSGTDFDKLFHAMPKIFLNEEGKATAIYLAGVNVPTWDKNSIGIVKLRGDELINLPFGTCTDTDGGNKPETRGTVTDKFGTAHLDRCTDENNLVEYYCSGIEKIESPFNCGNGKVCKDGACIQGVTNPCTDADVSIVSDTTTFADGNPSVATWVHPAWTANIPGATWIWKEYLVSNPATTTTVTFTRTFNLPLGSKDFKGTFVIAADDKFKCYLNSDSSSFTEGAGIPGHGYYEDQYKVTAAIESYLKPGANILKCEITNIGGAASGPWQATAQNNPAGLLYKLTASSKCEQPCGNGNIDAGEECDGILFKQGDSCASRGFTGGNLRCIECHVNTGICTSESGNNAQFLSQSAPSTMNAGSEYSVSVTMKNTGTTEWKKSDNYRLGSQNPQDNSVWGVKRADLPESETVKPNEEATFIFTVKAPSKEGKYNFQWESVQESKGWFGESTENVEVVAMQPNRCGDGNKRGSEECDDGNQNNNDACSNDCKNAWALTCNYPGSDKIPTSHTISLSGTKVSVNLGFSDKFAGIGSKFEIVNNEKPTPVDILETRSGAGAAWQYTSMIYPSDKKDILINQGAGNGKGYQWGYKNELKVEQGDGTKRIYSSDYVPNVIDSYNGKPASPCEPFDPVENNAVAFYEGRPEITISKIPAGNEQAIKIENSYQLKSVTDQNWKVFLPVHAFYMSRAVARAHNLRFYYGKNGGSVYGPYKPYDEMTGLAGANPVNHPLGTVWQIPADMDYGIFVWTVEGKDIAVAIPLRQYGSSLRLEKTIYCQDPNNDACGSIDYIFNDKILDNAQFPKNSEQKYTFTYIVGTVDELEKIGYSVSSCIPSGGEESINRALVGEGSKAKLCRGSVFELKSPVFFTNSNQEIYTEGYPTDDSRAVLRIARPDVEIAVNGRHKSGIKLKNVIVDGSRPKYGHKSGHYSLIMFGGDTSNQEVDYVKAYDTQDWSTLAIFEGEKKLCSGVKITNSEFGPAGESDGTIVGEKWSDGISLSCRNSIVTDNRIIDATDGAIVVFGAPGSLIARNTIIANTRPLFGGIVMVDNWPYEGDYRGTIVTENTINAAGAQIKVGIAMGALAWAGGCYRNNFNTGGTVTNNVLKGRFMGYGFAVDGAKEWTVTGNRDESTHTGEPAMGCDGKVTAPPKGFQKNRLRSSGTFQNDFEDAVFENILNLGTVSSYTGGSQGNSAQFVSQIVPPMIEANHNYYMSVTMKNTGTTTWTRDGNYFLGSQNPQDNNNWGSSLIPAARLPLAFTDPIKPGESATFTFFPIRAPANAGIYNFQWRMVQEFKEWFGDFTPNVPVTINPAAPAVLAPARGPYIDGGLDASRATSFSSSDKLAMTYLFYWYDKNTNLHVLQSDDKDYLKDHPPTLDNPDFSYTSVAWFEKQLKDMNGAGIDVVLPVYWGFPIDKQSANPSNHDNELSTATNNAWSNIGLTNLVQAARNLNAQGIKTPKIGMFYDTSTLYFNDVRRMNLKLDSDRPFFWGTVRDFWSQIPPELWAQIDGKPVTATFSSNFAVDYDQGAFDYLRGQFRQHFGGKEIYLINHVSWNGISSEKTTDWGTTRGITINGVVQVGAGYDDSLAPGRGPSIRARDNGKFYSANWDAAIKSGKKIIIVETWNEFHEASDIAESKEYGRQYINLTKQFVTLWKSPVICGNGVKEGTEECDDGNTINGDGCSSICKIEKCSDGTLLNQCSSTKPKFCSNGNLINKASQCGCPAGLVVSGEACVLPCILKSAAWEKITATESEDVKLIVEGENCNGKQITFVVKENDIAGDDDVVHEPASVVFADNKAITAWKAEWQDDGILGGTPEYYFTAATDNAEITSQNELVVTKAVNPPVCGNGNKEGSEECDDGNIVNDDGCTNECKKEPATLSASPVQIKLGSSASVAYSGTSTVTDWIGLYSPAAADDKFIDWKYVGSCSRTPSANVAASGTCSFAMSNPGSNEFRLFSNDGYTKMAASNQISVTGPALTPIEFTTIDSDATGYGTFQSNNQKIIQNQYGIFMTYMHYVDPAPGEKNNVWRLARSTDGGKTFITIFEETSGTRAPVIETDASGTIYLIRSDYQDTNAYLYRFSPGSDFKNPVISKIPNGTWLTAKHAMAIDEKRNQLYYFLQGGALISML